METQMAEEITHAPVLSLTLQVMNGNELESGRAAKCLFTADGGEIGNASTCHWPVQDRAGSVAERAFQVVMHDGTFCLKSTVSGLMINGTDVHGDRAGAPAAGR